jgi:hypothetical protein
MGMVQDVCGHSDLPIERRNGHTTDIQCLGPLLKREDSDYLLPQSNKLPVLLEEVDF